MEIISYYTREKIEALTVSAYDPLANTKIRRHTSASLTLRSIHSFEYIPETVNHITVLHPDPVVIVGSGITIEAYRLYTPVLIDIIRERLQPGGYIFVQLDDQIRDFETRLLYRGIGERFIDTLKRL